MSGNAKRQVSQEHATRTTKMTNIKLFVIFLNCFAFLKPAYTNVAHRSGRPSPQGCSRASRRWTASKHFFVWNDPFYTFYIHCTFVTLQTSGVHPLLMASRHFHF